MLLLADRNFCGHELWGAGRGHRRGSGPGGSSGTTSSCRLPDGSFLSVMGNPAENLRHGEARRAGRPLPIRRPGSRCALSSCDVTIQSLERGVRTES